eukprot:4198494-Prymnesium_polylepis.1
MSPSRLAPAKRAHIVSFVLWVMSMATMGSCRSTGTPRAIEHARAYTSRRAAPSSWSRSDDGGVSIAMTMVECELPGSGRSARAAS